jgi:hypothetical protein
MRRKGWKSIKVTGKWEVEEKKNETALLCVIFIPSLFRTVSLHKKK